MNFNTFYIFKRQFINNKTKCNMRKVLEIKLELKSLQISFCKRLLATLPNKLNKIAPQATAFLITGLK